MSEQFWLVSASKLTIEHSPKHLLQIAEMGITVKCSGFAGNIAIEIVTFFKIHIIYEKYHVFYRRRYFSILVFVTRKIKTEDCILEEG